MNYRESSSIVFNIKDMFLFILRKMPIVMLAGAIVAILLGGYDFLKDLNEPLNNTPVVNVLDIDTRIEGESEIEYDKRVQLVNRAQTIMANIAVMNDQSDKLLNYISASLLMQLDPMNVSVSEAQLIIELDSGENAGLDDALMDAYTNVVTNGDYLLQISENCGYSYGSLQELASAWNTKYNSDVIIADETVPVRVMTIRVLGDTTEFTEAMLDGAINEIFAKQNDYASSIAKHTILEINRQSYVSFMSSIRDAQLKLMSEYQTLQSQIDSSNRSLDDIAKQLGLTDRNDFYSDASSVSIVSTPNKPSLKHIAIWFLIGLCIGVALYMYIYLFGRKVITQAQFYCLFPECKHIGVLKPLKRRNKLLVAIERLSGDDTKLASDKVNALVAANLKNMTNGMSKILITGTIDEGTAKQIVNELNLICDIKTNIFSNPEILSSVSDYDGVVILEQRGVSEKKIVRKELELLSNGTKSIVGAIVI